MQQLKQKRAVITGAGSGIGAAIALAYASEGAHLVLGDRDPVTLDKVAEHCRQLGAQVHECVADVGSVEGRRPVSMPVSSILAASTFWSITPAC